MPIYEYVCDSCKHEFEKIESIKSEHTESKCEKCGKVAHRKISLTAYHLSGSGFHNTDYKPHACEPSKSEACATCPCAAAHK